VVVRIVLDHLGGACDGTNSLRSSWWGLCYFVVRIVLNHLGGVCITRWYE
jgi:hypothetical protein